MCRNVCTYEEVTRRLDCGRYACLDICVCMWKSREALTVVCMCVLVQVCMSIGFVHMLVLGSPGKL